jgi:hypothetical protein
MPLFRVDDRAKSTPAGFDHRKRRLAATSMVNGSFALVDHLIAAVDRRSWVLQ